MVLNRQGLMLLKTDTRSNAPARLSDWQSATVDGRFVLSAATHWLHVRISVSITRCRPVVRWGR
ncbi:MAG: hypothetical protein DMD79_01195 [Candidatus Rokuibacteriota bacterium]|nr:MAG: hypothetical protein DMD79_01195 [Candidatus Rokubacteria bacterium]